MRLRLLVAIAASAALVAGCGDSDSEEAGPQIGTPPEEFAPKPPGEEVAGTVAVVDLKRKPLEQPETLAVSSDATLEDLEWTDWGEPEATATGTYRLNTCKPTCAAGKIDEYDAEVTLSSPVDCEGQRYYSEGEVAPDGALQLGPPAVFVETPC